MTRQEANKKILEIIKYCYSIDILHKADCVLSPSSLSSMLSHIEYEVDNCPDLRWCQIMWSLGINYEYGDNDRFYEESVETLNKLKQ